MGVTDFAQPRQWQKVGLPIRKIQTSFRPHFEKQRNPSQHVDLFNGRRGQQHPLFIWIEQQRQKEVQHSIKQVRGSLC